jgi:hypothetical protein
MKLKYIVISTKKVMKAPSISNSETLKMIMPARFPPLVVTISELRRTKPNIIPNQRMLNMMILRIFYCLSEYN